MHYLRVSGLPVIKESDATAEVAALFEEGKRVLEMLYVPNIAKALATAPNVLAMTIECYRAF
jgi:hypothetical protein